MAGAAKLAAGSAAAAATTGGGELRAAAKERAPADRRCNHLRVWLLAGRRQHTAYAAHDQLSSRSSIGVTIHQCQILILRSHEPRNQQFRDHEPATEGSGGAAESETQERAVRRPPTPDAPAANDLVGQRALCFPSKSASAEPASSLRCTATCCADVAAPYVNAMRRWAGLVIKIGTPLETLGGDRGWPDECCAAADAAC